MGWDSTGYWRGHRRGGNWWIVPLVIFALIILTHGWILILPLMALAAFALVGFVLPRLAWHMHNGERHGEWGNNWHQHMQEWGEKRKRYAEDWHRRYDEKPKRKSSDDIEYV